MKILHLIEDAVLIVDQAVNLITGSVSLRRVKGEFELSCLGLERHQLFKDDFMRHIGACPLLKSPLSVAQTAVDSVHERVPRVFQ